MGSACKHTWRGSAEALENFWQKLKSKTFADNNNPLFRTLWNGFWNYWHTMNPKLFASPEA